MPDLCNYASSEININCLFRRWSLLDTPNEYLLHSGTPVHQYGCLKTKPGKRLPEIRGPWIILPEGENKTTTFANKVEEKVHLDSYFAAVPPPQYSVPPISHTQNLPYDEILPPSSSSRTSTSTTTYIPPPTPPHHISPNHSPTPPTLAPKRRRRPTPPTPLSPPSPIIGNVTSSGKFCCVSSECADITFGRQADFRRHYDNVHAVKKKEYFCNVDGILGSMY
ncbi:hypothetical protein GQ44DRAFT_785153 [Phaeosphaeriaceae sp. PMI808]|nr:hypothetical protein GQ44DRAFT_785153 [Phaeosphaeriaceae sp. PMI808]